MSMKLFKKVTNLRLKAKSRLLFLKKGGYEKICALG